MILNSSKPSNLWSEGTAFNLPCQLLSENELRMIQMSDANFNYKKFGQGVRYFRVKNNLTQLTLAELADMSSQHLINIETGHAHPSATAVINLCNGLNVSINDCLADDHESGKLLYRQFRAQITHLNDKEKVFLRDTVQNLMRL